MITVVVVVALICTFILWVKIDNTQHDQSTLEDKISDKLNMMEFRLNTKLKKITPPKKSKAKPKAKSKK